MTISPGVKVGWCTWSSESYGALDLPFGTYRVRFSAEGRDLGFANEFADGVVDRYLVEFWAAEATPDAISRATSANATSWHHEVGHRR